MRGRHCGRRRRRSLSTPTHLAAAARARLLLLLQPRVQLVRSAAPQREAALYFVVVGCVCGTCVCVGRARASKTQGRWRACALSSCVRQLSSPPAHHVAPSRAAAAIAGAQSGAVRGTERRHGRARPRRRRGKQLCAQRCVKSGCAYAFGSARPAMRRNAGAPTVVNAERLGVDAAFNCVERTRQFCAQTRNTHSCLRAPHAQAALNTHARAPKRPHSALTAPLTRGQAQSRRRPGSIASWRQRLLVWPLRGWHRARRAERLPDRGPLNTPRRLCTRRGCDRSLPRAHTPRQLAPPLSARALSPRVLVGNARPAPETRGRRSKRSLIR